MAVLVVELALKGGKEGMFMKVGWSGVVEEGVVDGGVVDGGVMDGRVVDGRVVDGRGVDGGGVDGGGGDGRGVDEGGVLTVRAVVPCDGLVVREDGRSVKTRLAVL